jgi:xylulokinase
MLPHDYINYWLTGFFTMEASDASGTGLLDPTQRCWDSARLEAVGEPQLMEWLPARLLAPNEPAGKLKPEIASQLGLPQGLDVTVGPGGGDNAMAALGCGAVREGAMVLSLGTSGTLFGAAPQPVIDLSGAICPFCDATGRALPLLCTINCCSVVEEVRRLFNLDHETMAELIAEEPVGCHGVTMLPYLAGERTPNWPTATGTILGLRPGLLRSGVLARAAMEGVTFSLLSGLRVMESYGLRINELRVVGGGSKNASWRRIITDAFQLPLTFPIEPEAAAFGAALQAAAVTAGTAISDFIEHHPPMMEKEVLYPNPKHAEEYNSSFQRFQDLGHTLFS